MYGFLGQLLTSQSICITTNFLHVYHVARGPSVLEAVIDSGSSTPLDQWTNFGAFACRSANVFPSLFTNPGASLAPRWFTSTFSGVSLNLSQQSPAKCWCASGSKQPPSPTSLGHQTNTLHGKTSAPIPSGFTTCSLHRSPHSSAVSVV